MPEYTQIGDVNTWWDVHGEGEPLLLLHPGGTDSRAWDSNLEELAESFRLYRYDRRGHGRTADVDGPNSFELMAADAIAFIEAVVGEPVHLFGHSSGGPVGLLVTQQRPDLVRRLVFAEAPFHYEGWLPGVLDPLPADAEEFLSAMYAEVSPDGGDHWSVFWEKNDRAHHEGPTLDVDDLAKIEAPVLLMFADNESEVDVDHIHAMHRALPDAQLAILPGTGHGLPADKPELCDLIVRDFLTEGRPRPA